jgi:aspartate aminotransferase
MRSQRDETAGRPPLSERTRTVRRSSIREMFDLAAAHDGEDLVHLEIGEPDFDTPPRVVEAATQAVRDGATHYTSNAGIEPLRRAIAADLDAPYDPNTELLVTAGAMEALALAVLTVVDPGDEVVVPTPAWPNYHTQATMAGGTFVGVPLPADSGFDLDPDPVVDAIGDETALVVLTTPSNPTGRVYDADAVREVAATAAAHDAFVVADEVYKDLTYDKPFASPAAVCDRPGNVLTVGSCSKTYAMTGWRVGWLAAPERVVDAAVKFHESTVACAPAVSQHAALAALEGKDGTVEEMHAAFADRRDFVVNRVAELSGVSCARPEGAFYAFLDLSAVGLDGDTMARRLLHDYGVVTAPGGGFGPEVDDHLRISFANDRERLAAGFDRIEAFLTAEGVR